MYKQWKKSLKLEPFEREYLKRYGKLPCYEKDYECPELRCELNLDGSCQDISTILMDIPDPDYGCSYFETQNNPLRGKG